MVKQFFKAIVFLALTVSPLLVNGATLLSSDTTLVQEATSSKLYLVQNGFKHHVKNLEILQSYKLRNKAVNVDQQKIAQLKNVSLIASSLGPRVYLIDDVSGKKFWITNEEVFVKSGYKWSDIFYVSPVDSLSRPNATLVKLVNSDQIYFLDYSTQRRYRIKSESDFVQAGFKQRDIMTVTESLLAGFKESGEFSSTQAQNTKPESITAPSVPSAESSNAPMIKLVNAPIASNTFAAGTSHNVVQRLSFTAPTTRPATITGLTLERQGLVQDDNIQELVVVDEDGFLLAEPATLSKNLATFKFSEPWQLLPRQTKTITVLVTFKRDLNFGTQTPLNFRLRSASDVVSTSPVTATFPVVGTTHKVVTAGSLVGALTIAADDAYGKNEVVIGEKDRPLNAFVFKETSGAEDVAIERLIVNSYGSLKLSDLTNLKITDDAKKTIATSVTIKGNYAAFVFKTPLLIRKNEEKRLTVRADIKSGNDLRGAVVVASSTDIRVVGQSLRYAIPVTAAQGQFPVGRQSVLEVQPGSVAVSLSKSSPQLSLPRGGNAQILATVEIKPTSQAVVWRRVDLQVLSSAGSLPPAGNVSIKEMGKEVVGSASGAVVQNNFKTISLTRPTLSANKTFVYEIIIDVSSAAKVGDTYQLILKNFEFDIPTVSDDLILTTEVSGAKRSVQDVTLLVRKNEKFITTAAIAGKTKVQLGSLLLNASAGEDIKLSEITLLPIGGSMTQFSDGFSNLTLEGVKLATPSGSSFRFNFNKVIKAGSATEFELYVDSTMATDGAKVNYRVGSILATGVKSGAKVAVMADNIETGLIEFKKSQVSLEAIPFNAVALRKDNKVVLGAFNVKVSGLEPVQISALTILEEASSTGASVVDGYTDLRLEKADDRKSASSSIASPVAGSGGDRLKTSIRVSPDQVVTYYVVANNPDPTKDKIQLRLTNVEAKGLTTSLPLVPVGVPLSLMTAQY